MLPSAPAAVTWSSCTRTHTHSHAGSPPADDFLDARHPRPSGWELKNRACSSMCSEAPALAAVGGSRGQRQPCPCLTAGVGTTFHSHAGLASSCPPCCMHARAHTHTHTHTEPSASHSQSSLWGWAQGARAWLRCQRIQFPQTKRMMK